MTREEIKRKALELYPDDNSPVQDYDNTREYNKKQQAKRNAYIKCWEDNFANHPQLPANLDEAARNCCSHTTKEGIVMIDEDAIRGFIMGAKWMAEQGETVEAEVYGCGDENEPEISVNSKSVKPGDKVIVQIRKAE